MSSSIHVNDLRVGMFIHLDLGWMAHPFPLSSFKISSEQQIETIRQLGLQQVRWSPERSELPNPGGQPPEPAAPQAAESAAAEAPPSSRRRDPLLAVRQQREATRRCEQQFSEACRELKGAMQAVDTEPEAAARATQQITRAMLDKMLGEEEPCVRVLVEGSGDRASVHAMNVAVLSLLMGRMFQLPADDLIELGVGALLHDVGKLDLPERVRQVGEDSTSAEVNLYRDHVVHGVSRGRRMNLSPQALLIVAQHHERADGSGFPKGVTLERMSAGARIVAMVNQYDNMCNTPNPAHALTPHEALSRMFSQSRNKFDTTMLNGFIRMMGIYPPGSVVQLTDDRYAVVMSVNSTRPLKPTVLVCDPDVPPEHALQVDLERKPDLGIRRSLKPQALPAFERGYLKPRDRVVYYFDKATSTVLEEEAAP